MNRYICYCCKEERITPDPVEQDRICKKCTAKGIKTKEIADKMHLLQQGREEVGANQMKGSKGTFEV